MKPIDNGDVQYNEYFGNLEPRFDYQKLNTVLCFSHDVKEHVQEEIYAEWFDINQSEKVTWLLIRIANSDYGESLPKYRNVKLANILKEVKVIKKRGEENHDI